MSELAKLQKKHGLYPDGILGRNTLKKIKEVFCNNSNARTAHFTGQLAHETNNFKARVESLNYSVNGLINTFSFYRKNPELARRHGRIRGVQSANQEVIANTVYSDTNRGARYKLGNIHPGDGWRFRGRGSIMITGRSNYEAFFRWMKLPNNTNPDLVATQYYWEAALWFFEVNKLWNYTFAVSDRLVEDLTKKINGGLNGYEHRLSLTNQYYRMLVH